MCATKGGIIVIRDSRQWDCMDKNRETILSCTLESLNGDFWKVWTTSKEKERGWKLPKKFFTCRRVMLVRLPMLTTAGA